MVISVEDRASPLLELLWIREAFDLRPNGGDLPPLLTDTPRRESGGVPPAVTRQDWEAAWPSMWADALQHAGREFDPAMHERLMRTANGSRERCDGTSTRSSVPGVPA
ncbi:hypothetical protein ACFC1I_11370 [Microbacterium sp. NPDC056044]|uniref:hypothetical protein n=1 Tax=Microbacterium sp. NPDC056044 TaxID=3345690 RepID=UPI0035DCFD00